MIAIYENAVFNLQKTPFGGFFCELQGFALRELIATQSWIGWLSTVNETLCVRELQGFALRCGNIKIVKSEKWKVKSEKVIGNK